MPNNHFSTTNLAATDVVLDTPTDNYCVLNALDKRSTITFAEGNLSVATSTSGNYGGFRATMGLPLTGKWYWECKTPTVGYVTGLGIADGSGAIDSIGNAPSKYTVISLGGWIATYNSGTPQYGVNVSPTSGTNWTQATNSSAGSVLMMAVDMDNGSMWWGLDGTWFANSSGTTANPATNAGPQRTGLDDGTTWFPYAVEGSGSASYDTSQLLFDFGQSGFAHTPPSGFKSLSTGNLPTPAIAKPSEHFSATTYTGNSTTNAITTGLEPDLLWIKNRGASSMYHQLFDDVRGLAAGALVSNNTDAEDSVTRIASLDSAGFTTSSTNYDYTNGTGNTYVAWSWKGGTALTQSGTHTYELQLEVTDSGGDGWDDWGSYTTPRLQVWEGATSLGYASHIYDGNSDPQYYTIKTNNKDAIKIVWDYDSSNTGTLNQQGATLTNGSTVIQTAYTTSDTLYDGEVWITQSTSTNESTVGTLATGTPASYPSSNYNAAAGFSIAKWTGDDTGSGSGQTVNHNLGVAPEMIIAKNRTSTASGNGDWMVYHKDVTSGFYIRLNTNGSETVQYTNTMQSITSVKVDFYSDTGAMNYLNYGGGMGYAAEDYIAYMFASVEGYSKVGSYTGNNSTDGPFVYCGFRPRWICVKSSDGTGPWVIIDTARDPYNDTDATLAADTSTAESSYAATSDFDILSNGFKLRHSVTYGYANNADTYIFYSVAESPLKTANAR